MLAVRAALLLVVLIYAGLKALQHRAFDTRLYDTGIYQDLVARLARGGGWSDGWSDVLWRGHFGEHFNPIVWLLAALYRLGSIPLAMPGPVFLLVVQGFAVGLTAVGLWQWRRAVHAERSTDRDADSDGALSAASSVHSPLDGAADRILGGVWWVAIAAYAPLHAAWAGEFSPIVLGMPMVAFGLAAAHARRWGWVWVWAVLLLTTRESAPLSVLGLAIYAGVVRGAWRQAAGLTVFAGLSAAVILGWVLPSFREASAAAATANPMAGDFDGRWHQADRLGPLNDLGNKGRYLVLLLLPLAGMPLFGWRATTAFLAALPGILLNVATNTGNQYAVAHHYDAQLGVFVVVASGLGLDRARAWIATRPPRMQRFSRYALAGVWGVWIFALAAHTPVQQWRVWRPDDSDRALRAAIREVLEHAPPDTRWAADDVVGPQVIGHPLTAIVETTGPGRRIFIPIKVDTRESGAGVYPYVQRLAAENPYGPESPTLILLARRSWDFAEHRAVLEATGRVEVLNGDEPEALLMVLRWAP